MNVTENYMLQQMQQMAASMTTVPQTGGSKEKDGTSFQELMDQAGKTNNETAGKETGEKAPVKDREKTKDPEAAEKAPAKKGEEELRPQDMTGNPNAVNYLELFRPEITQAPVQEAAVEVPIEAIPQETAEGVEMQLSGELPTMDSGVQTSVQTEVPMEERQDTFQSTVQEEAPVQEAPQTAETAPERVEETDEPRRELPDAEIQADSEEEAPEEAGGIQQPMFRETETAPVKVGETYETVDTRKPDMDQQLANTIRQAAQTGAERIEIRLTPQNLGALTIEMTRDVNGALQVVLHASSSRAAGLLTQHLNGLHAALQGYSQEPVHVEVQRSQESQQQNFQHQADPDGRGSHQHQRQEQRQEEHSGGTDFLQKLRLGLFGTAET